MVPMPDQITEPDLRPTLGGKIEVFHPVIFCRHCQKNICVQTRINEYAVFTKEKLRNEFDRVELSKILFRGGISNEDLGPPWVIILIITIAISIYATKIWSGNMTYDTKFFVIVLLQVIAIFLFLSSLTILISLFFQCRSALSKGLVLDLGPSNPKHRTSRLRSLLHTSKVPVYRVISSLMIDDEHALLKHGHVGRNVQTRATFRQFGPTDYNCFGIQQPILFGKNPRTDALR
jgi:hypothetical protein